ncbi:MAG: ATP-binding protein [Acidobacteria bacterium]|nr:ATP-binding protein [Acidobacteriota bacterium]
MPVRNMKNHRLWTLLVLLLFADILCLYAQIDFLGKKKRFEHISSKEGLSQSAIYCILQDSKGFMWFGTQDGLNRYDGIQFTVYRNEQDNPLSLVKNWIYTIYESQLNPGVLWIGTSDGLCTYNSRTDTFAAFSSILGKEPVTAIIEDQEGNIWFGSAEKGLVKYDPKSNYELHYKSNATVLMKDNEGNIWIGCNKGGLSKYDCNSQVVIPYVKSPDGLIDDRVLALFSDHDGDIWIGTDGGGLILRQKNKYGKEIFTHFPPNPNVPGGLNNGHIKTIIQDKSGLIWIGTNGGGLSCFHKEKKQFISYTKDPNKPYSLSHNDIEVIYEDRAGSLWIGTQGEGINKIDGRYDHFALYQYEPYNPGLKNEKIWSIVEGKDGHFWIGTDGGIYKFDIHNDKFQHINHDPGRPNSLIHNQVLSICEDNAGNLWIGTDGGGLYNYDPVKRQSFHYSYDPLNSNGISHDRILSIIRDSSGILWFGTDGGGIFCLDPSQPGNKPGKELTFTRYTHIEAVRGSLSHNKAFTIYEDKNKTIWVGTSGGGLNRFDPIKKSFQHFNNNPAVQNSLSDNSILSIYMDSTGALWIGTVNGLNKFDLKSETWTRYTMKNGLPNNIIYGILEEDHANNNKTGNLWISTNMGLSRFNPGTGKIKNYDIHDGLQSNEFNTNAYTKSKNGIMFFGGVKGFNVFDPRQIKNNDYVPPVILTDFFIATNPVTLNQKGHSPLKSGISETREIYLSYLENSFVFGFIALNYVQPMKNRYMYKLEGYNEDWISQETRQMVFYTKVPAGNYVFKVKASNNDGIWNDEGASVVIHIAPPLWLSWWFILLSLFFLLGILFVLHRQRTKHIKEKLEKIRLENELQLKADFTAMLVHDLRSPLTAIVGYAQMMEEMPMMVDMRKTGKVISRSCDNMLRLINDMLDLSKFEAGKMVLNNSKSSLYQIASDNLEVMMPLIKKKEITLLWDISSDVKGLILFIDSEKIGQVLNNLFSNAIKFVPDNKKGVISITLKRFENEYIECSVSNNGPVVPESDRDSLFNMYAQLNMKTRVKGTGLGLAVSKVIIESHGGTIKYRPGENGIGSTFYFRLPLYLAIE